MGKYRRMSMKNLTYEERITDLENKLIHCATDLEICKKESEEFIYIASHDLNAPLRKLSIFTERLSEHAGEGLGEEALSYLKRIQSTVESMKYLVNGLSALADIENDVNFGKCDLNLIINEVLKESEEKCKKNNVSILISPLPVIEANASQIKEVFKHLIQNSILFQPQGQSAKIAISAELLGLKEKKDFNLSAEREYYQIRFSDNGIGFKQEFADDIFKPFKRLHGKSTYPGNGLGLAICKKITIIHEGIIYAKANEDQGSIFILILPQIHQKIYADAKSN